MRRLHLTNIELSAKTSGLFHYGVIKATFIRPLHTSWFVIGCCWYPNQPELWREPVWNPGLILLQYQDATLEKSWRLQPHRSYCLWALGRFFTAPPAFRLLNKFFSTKEQDVEEISTLRVACFGETRDLRLETRDSSLRAFNTTTTVFLCDRLITEDKRRERSWFEKREKIHHVCCFVQLY